MAKESDIQRRTIYFMGTAIALVTFIFSSVGLIPDIEDFNDEMGGRLLFHLAARLIGALVLSNYSALPYFIGSRAVSHTCWPYVFIVVCTISFFFDLYIRAMVSILPETDLYAQVPLYSPALMSLVVIILWYLMPDEKHVNK